MNRPRRRRPTWAWHWPHIRWVREELTAFGWVEFKTCADVERAYADTREVLSRPGTTADKKAAFELVLKENAAALEKLDDESKV